MVDGLALCLQRMQDASAPVRQTFTHYYKQIQNGVTGMLSGALARPVDADKVIDYHDLPAGDPALWHKTVVVKLNGGLGTSMGLIKAKSLLPVRGELSFLDILARQILHLRQKTGTAIPLLFMNSYNTSTDTLAALAAYPELPAAGLPLDFLQNRFPRLKRSDLTPLELPDDSFNWNPPGHGDIYTVLFASGILKQLLQRGYHYLFVSNADNLGATPDLALLTHFAHSGLPFMMEVCRRTPMDKKGGHLAQNPEGGLLLRESAQCPPEETELFQDIDRYRYFNTNNLWLHLPSLQQYLNEHNGVMDLPLILNGKTAEGVPVWQIETAMGAALSIFPDSGAVLVPRSRFAPVKKTGDLLVVWSDCYKLGDDYSLNPVIDPLPVVDLAEEYYGGIDKLRQRVQVVPSLKDCTKLIITGDVSFGAGVAIKGNVTITGSGCLENTEIIGNN